MDLDMFKDLIGKNYKSLAYLVLYNLGEPFLYEGVFDMIKFAVSQNIYVKVSTNGFFKEKDTILRILDSGLDEILISLDFLDSQSYQRFKNKDVFLQVTNNIKDIIKYRGSRKKPFVAVQFLLVKHKRKSVEEIKSLSQSLGVDDILFKKVRLDDNIFHEYREILPDDKNQIRDVYCKRLNARRFSCLRPWISLVVLWDGTIVPCCLDFNADYPMGNLNQDSLAGIWNSIGFVKFRNTLLAKEPQTRLCAGCSLKGYKGNFIKKGSL